MKPDKSAEKHQITIRLPQELFFNLGKEADKLGISLNAYILMLINIGFDKSEIAKEN